MQYYVLVCRCYHGMFLNVICYVLVSMTYASIHFCIVVSDENKTLRYKPCNAWLVLHFTLDENEPPREKTNNVVSEQVPHKPTCTSTEKS